MDCSPPGSSVHNVFQGRILQQVAISYPREVIFPTQGSIYPSSPGSPALADRVFISEPPGKHRPAARIYLILARGGRQGDCCQVGGGGGRSPSWVPTALPGIPTISATETLQEQNHTGANTCGRIQVYLPKYCHRVTAPPTDTWVRMQILLESSSLQRSFILEYQPSGSLVALSTILFGFCEKASLIFHLAMCEGLRCWDSQLKHCFFMHALLSVEADVHGCLWQGEGLPV